jgi:hypothetical protein
MRTPIAAFLAALLTLIHLAPAAEATPTQVNVRIEGGAETLFEGPILTEGHNVRAASDTEAPAAGYRCNGLNNGANLQPGPTPTAAAVDAMSIIGEDFDGEWYPEPFEDYFIERWGPEAEDVSKGEHWGLVVNNVFTDVGGCQYRVDGGDEVLWTYDAFDGRPRLVLYPGDYLGGALPLTATATLNEPFEVEVDSWSSYNEGDPPPAPTRSTTPYTGAEVAPVLTSAKGFQKPDPASPETEATGADGQASITFTEPGWHRIKATDFAAGAEVAIRSNRLDVCVPQPPATDCGTPPADSLVRTPPGGSVVAPPSFAGQAGPGPQPALGPLPPPAEARRVRLRALRIDRSRLADGLVKVSWRVLDAGVGIRQWEVASKPLARRSTRWVRRARGSGRTFASIHLPRGPIHELRLSITDAIGRSSSVTIGRVRVPD